MRLCYQVQVTGTSEVPVTLSADYTAGRPFAVTAKFATLQFVRQRWKRIQIGGGFLLLALLACALPGGPPAGSPVPVETAPARETAPPWSGTAVAVDESQLPAGNRFAPYGATPPAGAPAVPDYPFDLTLVRNQAVLQGLGAGQREMLASQGFVIVEEPFPNLYVVYATAGAAGEPYFVTADVVLYTVQRQLAYARQQAARAFLAADLLALSEGLVAASAAQLEAAPDEETAAAARFNVAFFSVGARLLNPAYRVPAAVAGPVADELTLIEGAAGQFISPLRGITADYALFDVVTADETLRRFRQAMIWYGQTAFPLVEEELVTAREAARRILLLDAALAESENFARWERIAVPAGFLWGSDGALSPLEGQVAAAAVFGTEPAGNDLEQLDHFIATLRSLGPRPLYRFLPRPQRPDEVIFPELVFNRVGGYEGEAGVRPFSAVETSIGPVRGVPRGLDVAAVLGAEDALAALEESGDTQYEGYDFQMATLRQQFSGRSEAAWTETLDGGWLYGLQLLTGPARPGAPPFTQSAAWQARELETWFGGWALMRHEPLLDAAGGTSVPITRGYVEPLPGFYGRLAALMQQTLVGLDSRGLIDKGDGERLLRAARLIVDLQAAAEQELQGEQPDSRVVAEALVGLALLAPGEAERPGEPAALPFVVDVYHNPQHGLWLQAAVGEAWLIYVLVPLDGELVVAVGAVFSTYEYARPAGERYTNEVWRGLEEREERE